VSAAPRRLDPAEIEQLIADGEKLFQKGKFVDALTAAEKAVRNGGGVPAHLLVAKIHLESEDHAQAVQAYGEALKLAPNDEDARRGLERAQTGMKQPR
jgi:tetratricopeptide (TPR) repeat protein